jgi:hypothetical protein
LKVADSELLQFWGLIVFHQKWSEFCSKRQILSTKWNSNLTRSAKCFKLKKKRKKKKKTGNLTLKPVGGFFPSVLFCFGSFCSGRDFPLEPIGDSFITSLSSFEAFVANFVCLWKPLILLHFLNVWWK